ncbi:MAG: hypothetical protein F7C07_06860 [Desulfurococcales archaeon]|nr:hypothetical protein [Desulfurococcales archaeon]
MFSLDSRERQLKRSGEAGGGSKTSPKKPSIDHRLSVQLCSNNDFLSEELISGDYGKIFDGSISLADLLALVEKELPEYDRIVGLITRDNIDIRLVIEGGRIGVAGIYAGSARPIIGVEAFEVLSNMVGRAVVFAKPRRSP